MKEKLSKLVVDVMKPVSATLSIERTVGEAVAFLKKIGIEDEDITYFYVVDKNNKLIGVVSARQLLFTDEKTLLAHVSLKKVLTVNGSSTVQDAMELFTKHRFLAFPVVNDVGQLLGRLDISIFVEKPSDVATEQKRKDIFQFIGLSLEEARKISVFKRYFLRMPWIFMSLVSGIICAIISDFHAEVLGKVILITVFIPMVLTLSESVAMQSMSLSLQFLKHSKLSWFFIWGKILKELRVLFLMGSTTALIVGIVALFFGYGFHLFMTVTFGIFFSIVIASSLAMLVPLVIHKADLDPKVAAGPVVLMCSDVLTTFIYFSLANWWLL